VRASRSLLLAAAALLAGAFLAGCEESTNNHKPRSMQTVLLSPDKPATPVYMDAVTGLTVSLPSPAPDTDYVWEIVSNNTRVLMELSPLRRDAPGAIGAKGTTSMTFYGAHPGHSLLRFVLVHPKDTDAIPAAKCVLAVTVRDLD
jgi:predicted secreted protein